MTDHEAAAMEAAYTAPHVRVYSTTPYFDIFRWGWEAARKYEPPKMCDERYGAHAFPCTLFHGHDGEHRATFSPDAAVVWSRT